MTKLSIPDRPSVHKIRSRIAELKRIDLRTADVDFLKSRLELLFRGYGFSTPILMPGQILYRGVPWSEKPAFRSQLSYPPPEVIISHQRVNRPHMPMFYCSVAREAPFFELGLKPGDHLAVSKWRVNKRILVSNVGYTDEVFKKLGSMRHATPWWQSNHPMIPSATNSLIANFFATEFAQVVNSDEDHLYKMSIAIAEKLYLGPLNMDSFGGEFDGEGRIGGLIYPTIAMRANSDNVALTPGFVDRYLSLETVEWIRIDSDRADFKYQVTNLDFANSFGSDGQIDWKGRCANWTIGPGQQRFISVEHGKYVVRDELGNIVEPS